MNEQSGKSIVISYEKKAQKTAQNAFFYGGNTMTGKEISEMQTKYVLQGWSKQGGLNPTPVDHCEGIYIYDKDGKRYADMSSEQVNVNAGYAKKEMTEAIKAQLD